MPTFCKQNAQANKGTKRVDGQLTRRRKRKVRGKKRLLFVRWRRKEGNVEREWKLMRRERNRGVVGDCKVEQVCWTRSEGLLKTKEMERKEEWKRGRGAVVVRKYSRFCPDGIGD